MEQNYLDIYPSNSIARQIEDEPVDLRWIDQLVLHANEYIKIMEHENIDFLEKRQGPTIDSGETYKFLRSQERTRNTKLMLQYLITFLSNGLPLEEDLKDDLANPFDQLKSFIYFGVNLIKEEDVAEAILKEHEKLGLLNETNAWYYRGQIDRSYKNLTTALLQAQKATVEDYCKLFRAIQQSCIFWFSVRNEDPKRIRKSDILIYKLARFLLAKYEEKEEEK